ncbi:hypothetical protein [Absidia glauca]|uniref:SET domain-containing protein n=1 Tax=Absidia glauca TaxID=4829 RepID=A0A163KAD8_ABSGL|nr:hypothetical protein [Absidia glauca]
MATQEKLTLLKDWLKDNKVSYDQNNIEIRIKDGSFGVYALKNLPSKETVVKIPKECILSPKTTGIANILNDESIEGGCSLALAIMYELSHILHLKEDYNEIVAPLMVKYPEVFSETAFSMDVFQKVTTLVSSRAFEVDAYHENAMVPFADIFNHRSVGEHVHFETDFEVCDACGALDYCEHQYLDFLEQGSEGGDNDGSEGGDDDEGGWTEDDDDDEPHQQQSDDEEEEGPLPDLEQLELDGVNFWKDEEDDDSDNKDTCDMVLDRSAKKNEELFNTYGDHPSIALLNKYGFCYDNNPNDYVSVGEDDVVDLCLAVTKEMLRSENSKMDDEALDTLAVERTRPRWEFFLMNESVLCPSPEDEEGMPHEGDDDYEASGSDEEDHDHDDDDHDDHDHEHDEEGGCCGGHDETPGKGKSYFANVEGLYEDTLTCLLHIMFINPSQFDLFAKDTQNAVDYFESMATGNKKSKDDWKMKKCVYEVCKALSEHRRQDYLDDQGKWVSVQDDFEARKKATNQRQYYALTCRMNEKKIIEKSIAHYDTMIQECKPKSTSAKGTKRKPGPKKIRKTK